MGVCLSGGVAGLYDYGPTGCAVKANVTAFWRKVRALLVGVLAFALPLTKPLSAFRPRRGYDGGGVPQRDTRGGFEGVGPR